MLCGSAYLFLPGSPLPLLAWVGLAPLLLRLQSVAGFSRFYAEGLAMLWVMELFTLGHVFDIGAGWSLLAVSAQAVVTSGVFVVFWLLRRALDWRAALLALPACWTGWEWLYTKQPLQIPTLLGATQADFTPLIQFYDLTGVWGGTFLIVLSNALLALAIARAAGDRAVLARASAAIAAAVFVPPLAYGAWVFHAKDAEPAQPAIRVALTQTGDPAKLREALVGVAAKSSEPALPMKPDLLLWPETALRREATSPENLKLWMSFYDWVSRADVPVLTGITDIETYAVPPPLLARQGQREQYFNAAALVTPQLAWYALTQPVERALDIKVYRKRELFPFFERVPFLGLFPALHRFVWREPGKPGRNYGYGNAPVVFAFLDQRGEKRRVGAFICFEILFPSVAADLVRAGADLIATVSNDQHLHSDARWVTAAHAAIRAIETRRSVARVNTVGYSLVADAWGRVHIAAPLDRAGSWIQPVQVHRGQSLYVRWGDWLPAACAIAISGLFLFAAFLALIRRIRTTRAKAITPSP
ncbi:MAG: apolipoprotein N-acyltransferase, partial [Betaproteobacteria bacterium RIFCSPLOWO2_02_FULL_63_19]